MSHDVSKAGHIEHVIEKNTGNLHNKRCLGLAKANEAVMEVFIFHHNEGFDDNAIRFSLEEEFAFLNNPIFKFGSIESIEDNDIEMIAPQFP